MIWVAEIGSMHRGSKELAHRMIYEAALAGATIAKFQLGWPKYVDEGFLPESKEWPKKNIRYIVNWVEDLDRWCTEYGVEFMASIWSEAGLEAARSVNMKRYKIAHQMVDEELVKSVLDVGKQTFIARAFGDITMWNIENAKYIFTTDQYPTEHRIAGAHRKYGDKKFTDWYGYSDHTIGNEMCWLAVSRGAQYIEKHFTLDPTNLDIRDNSFSATPAEFKELVDVGNRIARIA